MLIRSVLPLAALLVAAQLAPAQAAELSSTQNLIGLASAKLGLVQAGYRAKSARRFDDYYWPGHGRLHRDEYGNAYYGSWCWNQRAYSRATGSILACPSFPEGNGS